MKDEKMISHGLETKFSFPTLSPGSFFPGDAACQVQRAAMQGQLTFELMQN